MKPARASTSYRALRVYWPVRWRLLLAARADRRAGLPVGLSVATPPVLRALFARRDDVCERERTGYLRAVQPLQARLAEIDAALPSLQRDLAFRTDELTRASTRPTEAELSVRRVGERQLAGELVRQRRTTEAQRRVAAARAALDEVQRRLDFVLAEQAHLQSQRQHQADVARSRALRFCEHTDRLAAIYHRALIRRHPQREALVHGWQDYLSPPPAWVISDDIPMSRPASGGAA